MAIGPKHAPRYICGRRSSASTGSRTHPGSITPHATLYVTPRGLTTSVVPDGKSAVTLTFDFHDHALIGETADMRESFPLEAMRVADFLSRTTTLVERLGGRMDLHGAPNEIPDAKPFAQDTASRP